MGWWRRRGLWTATACVALLAAGCSAGPSTTSPTPSASPSPAPSARDHGIPGQPTTPATSTPATTPTAPDSPVQPSPSRFAFPVQGEVRYGAAHHHYPATDVFAECGAAVVAPFAGTVTEVATQDRWRPATNLGADRGGLSVTLVGAGGLRFYASHLAEVAVAAGLPVAAGALLGRVGETGSAHGTGCHAHIGLSPAVCGPGDWWVRRGVVSPYEYLRSWQGGSTADPADELARWHARNGCPTEPGVYP